MRKTLLAGLSFFALSAVAHAQTCPTGGPQYYVSSSGDDAAAGTSTTTPWKTMAKVNAAKFAANACIHMLTDIVDNLVLDGANMSGAIGFDGGGKTLTAKTGATTAADGGLGVQTVYLTGLTKGVNFFNTTVRPAAPWTQKGIVADNGTTGTIYGNNVGGFTLQSGNADAAIDIEASGANLTITQNTVSGLNGVGSKDDHGIRADGYTGNITITYNTVLNIGGRSFDEGASNGYSGNGIAVGWGSCSTPSACTITVEHNLVHHTGGNTSNCGGPSGIIGYEVTSRLNVGYNEVHHIQPINPGVQAGQAPSYGCDWDGIDMDGGVSNASVYNNYTHDNFAAGFLAWMGDSNGNPKWGPVSYTNNYSKNDYAGGSNNGYWGAIMFATTGNVNGVVHFDNNYVDNSNTVSGAPTSAWMDQNQVGAGSTFTGNTVIARGNAILGQCDPPNDPRQKMTFGTNKYYAAAFNMGQNCGGVTPTTFASWCNSVLGKETGSSFGPLSGAPTPPTLPVVGVQVNIPPPPPPPPPPPTNTTLTVTPPAASVSGVISLAGTSGTTWVNIGLFDAAWKSWAVDVKPVCVTGATVCNWKLSVDTTKMAVGANPLLVYGFSVPAGQTGGTFASVPVTLNVVTVPPPPPPVDPVVTQLKIMTSDLNAAATSASARPKILAFITKVQADLAALRKLLNK